MDDDGLPDFSAMAEASPEQSAAERAAQSQRLAQLQERVGKRYQVARPGRTRVCQQGLLDELVDGKGAAFQVEDTTTNTQLWAGHNRATRVPREVVLVDDALLVFAIAKGGALTLVHELPLVGASARDRLCQHEELAFELRGGAERPLAVVLEAADATSKLSWWASVVSALSDAASPGSRLEAGWLHRGLVTGTLWSAAVEGDEAATVELVRYTLSGRQRGLATFTPSPRVGAATGVALGPGTLTLPPQPVLDIDAADDDGWTALHYAAQRGCTGVMEALLEGGARTDVVNGDFDSPLHVACARGDAPAVALLVANGAPVSMRNLLEQSPLSVALASPAACTDAAHLRAVVELLLTHGADAARCCDGDGLTPLHRVALLGRHRAAPDDDAGAWPALVSALVRSGADPYARAQVRVDDGHQDNSASGGSEGEESYTALHLACGAPVGRYYLPPGRAGADDDDDEDKDKDSGGGRAVEGARVDVDLLVALAEHGCPVNARSGRAGHTALHLLLATAGVLHRDAGGGAAAAALLALYLSGVQRLVGLGARLDVPDGQGVTPGKLAENVPGVRPGLEALAAGYAARQPPPHALSVGDRVARMLPKVADRGGATTTTCAGAAAAAGVAPLPTAGGSSALGALFGSLSLGKKLGPGSAVGCFVCSATCGGSGGGIGGRHVCRLCSATVCRSCSSQRFPLTPAITSAVCSGRAGPAADVDSDDDDAPPGATPGGAGTGPSLKMQAANKFVAGLSAISQVLAPPSNGAGASAGRGSDGVGGVGQAILSLAAEQRVCDPCFLLLCTATTRALAEQREFDLQKAAAQGRAVNFSDFARGPPFARNATSAPASTAAAAASVGSARIASPATTTRSTPSGGAAAAGSVDAQRAALFGPRSASGTPTTPGAGPGSARAQVAAQASSGPLQGQLAETHERLAQRGERLGRLDERMREMANNAAEFASLAEKLKAKSKRGFFGF